MLDTPTYRDADGQQQPDRRVNYQVRAVFDRAWTLIEPLLETGEFGAEASGFALSRKLRDHFPELAAADMHTLVSAALRLQRERRARERATQGLGASR